MKKLRHRSYGTAQRSPRRTQVVKCTLSGGENLSYSLHPPRCCLLLFWEPPGLSEGKNTRYVDWRLNWESEKVMKRRKERNSPGLSVLVPILKFRFRKPKTHCPSFIRRLSELKTDAIIVWQGMSGWPWLFYTIVWYGEIFLSTPQFILLQIEKVGLDCPDIPSHFNGLFSLNIKSLKIGSKVSNNSCPLKR